MTARDIHPDRLPLTAEELHEESLFSEAAAIAGDQLKRVASGYVLQTPGVLRHFSDCAELHAHVFHGHQYRSGCEKGPPQSGWELIFTEEIQHGF